MTEGPTSRLRMAGYCLVLTAFAFIQQPGKMVGDTKFDLVVAPGRFLARAFDLWDPQAAFGQVQNQAYGYFWPMGPFFLAGHVVGMPGWLVQRLWWSLLLCLAFAGVVLLARALRIGTPASQVLAGFAYALSPHVLTLLGPTSVEAWPSALAAWVLLPLVRGSQYGSARRAAALSALAVAMCGGVNAIAVAAVLPVGMIWLLTRARGPRRRSLLVWWPALTVLATLWWSLPLLLVGRYSAPFLDYIENAAITTITTSLPDVLAGTSDWVAYASPNDWVAGYHLGTTPLLVLDAAVVAGLGLAGIARRDNPHGRFLLLSVIAGVVLVTFGYDGPVHGWFAGDRQALLDGVLAPLRNLHKFDTVLRLPLVLGLAHLVGVFARVAAVGWGQRAGRAGILLAAVSPVIGVAMPAYTGQLAPPASVQEVPGYWRQAADYLASHSRGGTALEIPAAAFGDYRWGSPHDDILQTLAVSPWAVRNVVPLAQPGNVRMLDAITRETELGRPSARLADYLASNGVGYLVVRNDLAPFRTDAPDPVVLHQALDRSPGLHRVAVFGPRIGGRATFRAPNGVRVANNRGRQSRFAAVEVYQVGSSVRPVTAWRARTVPVVVGGPGARLVTDAAASPAILAGDTAPGRFGRVILTDGLPRREMAFTSVRYNESATMTARAPWRLPSVEHNHRLYDDMLRWETVERWRGIRAADASTSQAYADALPPLDRGRSPSAALDGDPTTSFSSDSVSGARGQWWRVRFSHPRSVPWVRVTLGESPRGELRRLTLVTAAGRRVVPAAAPGTPRRYALPPGDTSYVEVRASGVRKDGPGAQLVLDEVHPAGLTPVRTLATPTPSSAAPPDEIVLTRDQVRPACAQVDATTTCDDSWLTTSEDGPALNRTVTLDGAAAYDPALEVRARPGVSAQRWLTSSLPLQVTSSTPLSTDLAASAFAAVDKDTGTTWVANVGDPEPYLDLRWTQPASLRSVDLVVGAHAAASRPTTIRIVDGNRSRLVALDRSGHGTFKELRTDHVRIEFLDVAKSYSFERGGAVELPVGVSELRLPGAGAVESFSPYDELDLGCGSGPTVTVGDRTLQTSVRTSLQAVLGTGTIPAVLCPQAPVVLDSGPNLITVTPSVGFLPERMTLRGAQADQGRGAQPVAVTARRWGTTDRAVRLPERSSRTLLVVNENINPGWTATLDGRRLATQRVDGWRQGWIVPAGPAATVRLSYGPNALYRGALLAGGVGLLLVAAVALLGGARRSRPLVPSRRAGWADGLALLAAGGLVASWAGAIAVAVVLVARRLPAARSVAPWTAAILAGAAGGVLALLRDGGFAAHSTVAQVLAGLGLVFAVLGANGPAFFSRRNGRSRT